MGEHMHHTGVLYRPIFPHIRNIQLVGPVPNNFDFSASFFVNEALVDHILIVKQSPGCVGAKWMEPRRTPLPCCLYQFLV